MVWENRINILYNKLNLSCMISLAILLTYASPQGPLSPHGAPYDVVRTAHAWRGPLHCWLAVFLSQQRHKQGSFQSAYYYSVTLRKCIQHSIYLSVNRNIDENIKLAHRSTFLPLPPRHLCYRILNKASRII